MSFQTISKTAFCFTLTTLIAATPISVTAEIIVHETFSDNDIEDGSPAVWEYSNVSPGGPTCGATISIENGDAEVNFCSFAMWSLDSVNGEEIGPSNNWSIRARITGQGTGGSLPGVGIDSYFWAGGMYLPQFDRVNAGLGLGSSSSSEGGTRSHRFFEPWVVQLDVFPDRLEAYRWPADDPGNVSRGTWSKSQVRPGRPVFWGNWGGRPIFHEVVVADSPMGVGGDFDRSGNLDVSDIELLNAAIRTGAHDPRYNISNDEIVDAHDRDVWVHSIANTYFGDANLDGEFNTTDLIDIFQSSKYELDSDASWAEGDWNGDMRFNSGDLIVAFQDDGFEKGPRALQLVTSVPEPTSHIGLILCLLPFLFIVRHR